MWECGQVKCLLRIKHCSLFSPHRKRHLNLHFNSCGTKTPTFKQMSNDKWLPACKESSCNAGRQTQVPIPGSGRSPGRKMATTSCILVRNPMDSEASGYSPIPKKEGHTELQTSRKIQNNLNKNFHPGWPGKSMVFRIALALYHAPAPVLSLF